MKTLIHISDEKAIYRFEYGANVREVAISRIYPMHPSNISEGTNWNDDAEARSEDEYKAWLAWLQTSR